MINKLVAIGICLIMQSSVGAATEFLRFEGNIDSNYYPGFNDLFDLDFAPSQPIYFDFQIDTELDRPGVPDGVDIDYFASILTGGTLGADETSFGGSGRVIEYLFGFLDLSSDLQLMIVTSCDEVVRPEGCQFDDPIPPFDWQVGTTFNLGPEWDTQEIFGSVTLTYRDSQPPPPIPLPGAVWLMLSALLGTGWMSKVYSRTNR